MYNCKNKFISLLLIGALLLSSTCMSFAGTLNVEESSGNITPSLTVDYYRSIWKMQDISIIKSTDTEFSFIYEGHTCSYKQLVNNSSVQSIEISDNGVTDVFSKNLKTRQIYFNENIIDLSSIQLEEQPVEREIATSSSTRSGDVWGSPFDYSYYQVSWGDAVLEDMTYLALTTAIGLVIPIAGVIAGIAAVLYDHRDDPDYRFIEKTYIKKYKQLEVNNYYYYRNVWKCYKNSNYTDLIDTYYQIVY